MTPFIVFNFLTAWKRQTSLTWAIILFNHNIGRKLPPLKKLRSNNVNHLSFNLFSGPRHHLPNYLRAATPILPTSSLKASQWGAGWRRLRPLTVRTLRWSGQEMRPCSSRKSQDTRPSTEDPVAGPTLQRLKSQPSRLSSPLPKTCTHQPPTRPISCSLTKTHLLCLNAQATPHCSTRNGLHNPETNTKGKMSSKTLYCPRRTWGTCTWITRQSSGKKPDKITTSFSQKGPNRSGPPSCRHLSPTFPLT